MRTFKPTDLKIGDYVAYGNKKDEVEFGTIKKIENDNFYLDNGVKVYPCQLYALYTDEDPEKEYWEFEVKKGYIIDSYEHDRFKERVGKKLQELKDRSL